MVSRIPLLILLASCWLTAHGTEIGYAAKAVDLLDRPDRQAKALSKLARRQAVEIVGRDGSWARAKSGTATGSVRLGDLRLTATVEIASRADSTRELREE